MTDDTISDDELDVAYRRMVDQFIDQANELAEDNSPENVCMALLFAASRFNAYVTSQHAQTLEDYERDFYPGRANFFSPSINKCWTRTWKTISRFTASTRSFSKSSSLDYFAFRAASCG